MRRHWKLLGKQSTIAIETEPTCSSGTHACTNFGESGVTLQRAIYLMLYRVN